MAPDIELDKCPKFVDEEGKRYWHFSFTYTVRVDLEKIIGNCNPVEYGRQLHRLMDSYSHWAKSYFEENQTRQWLPPESWQLNPSPNDRYRRPNSSNYRISPDSFRPDLRHGWAAIDRAMYWNLINSVEMYNLRCCK